MPKAVSNHFRANSALDRYYEIGLVFKAIDGVLELIGGLLLLLLTPHAIRALTSFLARHAFSQYPHNFLITHIDATGANLAAGHSLFAEIFLLTHGLVKIGLVICLYLNKHWAYPLAVAVLGLLLAYQLFTLVVKPTFGMAFLSVIDAVIIWLIYREWSKQRATTLPTPNKPQN